jgi:hypothetical protein
VLAHLDATLLAAATGFADAKILDVGVVRAVQLKELRNAAHTLR